MYCRKCGKQIPDDSVFCSFCGEPIDGEKNKTYHYTSDPEFVWNVKDYPTGEKKKTEDIDFNWGKFGSPEPKIEKEAPKERLFSTEDLFRSIEKDVEVIKKTEQEENIDKFYTFNKKNEEFQKLLDKEYERIKKDGHEKAVLTEKPEPKFNHDTIIASRNSFEMPSLDLGGADMKLPNIENEIKFATGEFDILKDGPKEEEKVEIAKFDTLELQRDLAELGIGEMPDDKTIALGNLEEKEVIDDGFKPLFQIEQEEDDKKYNFEVKREIEKPAIEISVFPDGIDTIVESVKLPGEEQKKKKALDALWGTIPLEGAFFEAVEEGAKSTEKSCEKPIEELIEKPEVKPEEVFPPYEETKESFELPEEVEQGTEVADMLDKIFIEDTEESEKAGSGFFGFILTLIVIALMGEIVLVAAVLIAPESSVGLFISDKFGVLVNWAIKLIG